MAKILQPPAIMAIKGETASFNWRILSAYPEPRSPVDLSTWTATFTIRDRDEGFTLLEATPALTSGGDVSVDLTADQTATLTAARQIGGRCAAVYELNLNAPDPAFDIVMQGGVSIAGANT